jgi:hypothetical protein
MKQMKRTTLAIFATLLMMASTSFAATQASPGTSVSPTLQLTATVQTAIRLTLAAGTGCAFSAPTGGQDFHMDFGTVDALAINGPCANTGGAGKYNPTTPGVSDDTTYYSNYTVTPQFTSQAQSTGTVKMYVSSNFAANTSLTVVDGGTATALPAQASFAASPTAAASAVSVVTSAASGTGYTRWLGVQVAHTSGAAVAGVGSQQSATLTYTLTVP